MKRNNRIKILRILNGYSQGHLAQQIGVKQPSLAAYERDTYGVPEKILLELAASLRVDPAYLAYGYPALKGKVWELAKEGKGLQTDIKVLLPEFIIENKISMILTRQCIDVFVFLLISDDERYSILFSPSKEITVAVMYALHGADSLSGSDFLDMQMRSCVYVDVLMRNFDATCFCIKDLNNDYFSWPPGFFSNTRLPSDIKSILSFVIDQAMPAVIREATNRGIELGKSVNNPNENLDLFINCLTPRLKQLIESKVEENFANDILYLFDADDEIARIFEQTTADFHSKICKKPAVLPDESGIDS